jgi:uncharacterized protein
VIVNATSISRLVLDTNVVLDWLLFDDPKINSLREAIATQYAIVLTHDLAIQELRRVLNYPSLKLDLEKQAEVVAQYLAQTTLLQASREFARDNLLLPPNFPRCRDRSDQFLLALAYHGKADTLISHDKQILRMAKRLRIFSLRVSTAENYKVV